jgi:hypothetical protein
MEKSTSTASEDNMIPIQCSAGNPLISIGDAIEQQVGRFLDILLAIVEATSTFKNTGRDGFTNPLWW